MEKVETKRTGIGPKDIRTPEGIEGFMVSLLEGIRAEFEDLGTFRPRAYVLTTKGQNGLSMAGPGMHVIVCGGDFDVPSKDAFAAFLGDYLAKVEAFGIVFVSEVWTASDLRDDDDNRRPSERPDRREAIFVNLEHVALPGQRSYAGFIEREASGTPTLETFVSHTFNVGRDGLRSEGRFSGLLTPLKAKVN